MISVFFVLCFYSSHSMASSVALVNNTSQTSTDDDNVNTIPLIALMQRIHAYKPSWHLSLMFNQSDITAIDHAIAVSEIPLTPKSSSHPTSEPHTTSEVDHSSSLKETIKTLLPNSGGSPDQNLQHLNMLPIEEAPTPPKPVVSMNIPAPAVTMLPPPPAQEKPAPSLLPPAPMHDDQPPAPTLHTPPSPSLPHTQPSPHAVPTPMAHISNPETSAPRFTLEMLMYFNPKRWMIVINHHTITSTHGMKPFNIRTAESNPELDMHVQILKITEENVVLSWTNTHIKELSPNLDKKLFAEKDYYVNPAHTIRLNKAMDTIEFVLGVNQVFSLYEMEILDNEF